MKHADDIRKTELINLFDHDNQFVHKFPGRLDINDGKSKGHNVYAIDDLFLENFRRYYA